MAQPRTVYHVVPDTDAGMWKVKKEGAKRASKTEDNKRPAVKWAKRTAKKNKPSEVVVHKRDGTIGPRHTYKDDPLPPKG